MTNPKRVQTNDAWNLIAQGYDKFVTPTHLTLGNEALDRAGLKEGMTFLDVACGTGALSIPAAQRGARVTSTDFSPEMVQIIAERATKEGLSNLEARVMDGHALELDDNTFDIAGSQFGVMLFPDLPRAVRELVRVTKPGGRVVLVVFGPPDQVEFIQFMMRAAKSVVPDFEGLPADPPPLPFQVADPEKLRSELTDAGLRNVTVETITEQLRFRSGQEIWDWLMNSNPIPGMLVAGFTEKQKAGVRDELERLIRERAGDSEAAVLTNTINIGIGTR